MHVNTGLERREAAVDRDKGLNEEETRKRIYEDSRHTRYFSSNIQQSFIQLNLTRQPMERQAAYSNS